jgi:serine/threonine protein kinase
MVVFGGRILNAEDCMEYQNDVWIIKDIGKYIASVDEGHKTLQKLRERVGKIGAYSVSQRTPEISSSFNFVHKMHVDQDFRWDGNAVDIFKFKEKLGEGGFGEVFRAVQGDTKFELAIKVVKNTNKSSPEAEQLAKEMELLKKCRHPSIVQYFGFSQVNPTDSWVRLLPIL